MQLIDNVAPDKVVISEPENFNGTDAAHAAGSPQTPPRTGIVCIGGRFFSVQYSISFLQLHNNHLQKKELQHH